MAVGNRSDPSRTADLRRRFVAAMRRRFKLLRRAVHDLVAVEDAFVLSPSNQLPTVNTRYRFLTTAQKVEEFRLWLARNTDFLLIGASPQQIEQSFWHQYVEEGYRKGQGRAFDDFRKANLTTRAGGDVSDFFAGSRAEFLRQSFASPVAVEKVKLLAGRVLTELRGVTEAMSQAMIRELTDGLVQGLNPRDVAARLTDRVDSIGIVRAERIARTETIRAHAEGQLDALERMDVVDVGVMVEWSTAGDDRVCPLCAALDGIVLKVKEAHGLIPRHPNCRCAHIPANVGEDTQGQKRSKPQIERAIDTSIRREIPKSRRNKVSLEEQKRKTKWVGADVSVSKKRPKSILDEGSK